MEVAKKAEPKCQMNNDNPYESPTPPFSERDPASHFNPYRGLLWVPLGVGTISFAIAILAALNAMVVGIDNGAAIPIFLVASITLIPLLAGVASLLLGVPAVWLLRQTGRLTPGWVLISGGMLIIVLLLVLSMALTWLEYSRGKLDSPVNFLFSGFAILTPLVGLPGLGGVCAYAWWLSVAKR